MSAVGTTERTAARGQAELSVQEILAHLEERMERPLIGLAVDASASAISRWRSGESMPGHAKEARLRNLHTVFRMLEQTDGAHVARAWFMGMNPQLEDRSPLEAIAEGDVKSVLAAARAFAAGA
ncbi:hypothetical protein [Arthrobacter sp. UM1]|uniref:hypothetical protein n=1 Tax=Arthrobacter sp. UM1 TaxID=2766776 RepID=UPI001CF61294|nr:hypothetical protein [Arthrobacter sp. UM1]MCB4209061.1 XRE family transcriptional regulator [Arthrobacter sp. UM1]